MGQDTGRLFGQIFGGVDHLSFQGDLVTDMLTVLQLLHLPCTERHLHLQITCVVYKEWDLPASDTRHKIA